jgi:hydrogenase maturation protein HypF
VSLLDIKPEAAACDLHPDFPSTRLAEESRLPLLRVQHHAAHIAAVAAEYRLDGPLLGVALDGYGYGDDGRAWGGELMMISGAGWRRIGHLAPLPLPGGDRAVREIWRLGLAAAKMTGRLDNALLNHLAGDADQAGSVVKLISHPQTPHTTSLGRFFDAAAAILGLRREQTEEAQAAMELEAITRSPSPLPDGYRIEGNILDFSPLLAHLLDFRPSLVEGADLFHGTIAAGLAGWILRAGRALGVRNIALAGGCMTNRILVEELCRRLSASGMQPLLPRRAPANDGGVSLGQALLARRARISDSLSGERSELACVSPFRSG